MNYIIDANAILNITRELKKDAVEILENKSTVTLAPYEMGNAIWKECTLLDELDSEKASEILDFVKSMMRHMKVKSPRKTGLSEEALRTAIERNITYYDSVYLVVADETGETLVTDDGKLQKTAVEADVKAISSEEMVENIS